MMDSELRMADYAAAALVAQMRGLVAEREALDEWALRLGAAKQEDAAETRALFLEREALDTRARLLVEKESMRRKVFDSMVRQAFLLHPHVDDHQNVGMTNTEDKKRKASYLEPASGKENPCMKTVSEDDGQPVAKKEKLPQLEKKTSGTEYSNWWCDVCKLDCQGANAMASHLSGRRHKRMVKTSSEELPPLVGKSLSELESLKTTSGIREPLEKDEEASPLPVSESWCAFCKVNCPNSKALLAHQVGRKHLRRMLIESKKEAHRVHTAQEINACPLEEGKRENDECPSVKGSGVSNLDIAMLGHSECKNECIGNGLEKGNCGSLDLESPLATVSIPECQKECMDNGSEKGTSARLDLECPLASVSAAL